MNAAVSPVFTGGVFDTLRRALDTAPILEWPPEAVDDSVVLSQMGVRGVRRLRTALNHDLDYGSEVGAFLARYEPYLDMLSRFLLTRPNGSPEGNEAETGTPAATMYATLRELEQECRLLYDQIAPAVEQAKTPIPPVDLKRLEEGSAAIARGEYEDVESILARLLAGGDL